MPLSGDGKPDHDLFARIDIDLKSILSAHTPDPMRTDLQEEITAIREEFSIKRDA
jgi:hypothetical protein